MNTSAPPLSVSDDWASSYFSRRLYAEPWETASPADRRKALDWSSSLLSAFFVWDPSAYSGGTWCDAVLGLVCEEAFWLLENGAAVSSPAAFGVTRASAGPVSVAFSAGAVSAQNLIPPHISQMAAARARRAGQLGAVTSTMLP